MTLAEDAGAAFEASPLVVGAVIVLAGLAAVAFGPVLMRWIGDLLGEVVAGRRTRAVLPVAARIVGALIAAAGVALILVEWL
jgi:protein-S-isoprenylcysteine O-methyltransferase Ste14